MHTASKGALLLRREQGMREALGQRRPVVQAGQCIVVRLPGHLVAKVPAFGHIVEHQHAAHGHAVALRMVEAVYSMA